MFCFSSLSPCVRWLAETMVNCIPTPSALTLFETSRSGKSTLWTDTGVDKSFQGDLGAIGPYEFQGKSFIEGEGAPEQGP